MAWPAIVAAGMLGKYNNKRENLVFTLNEMIISNNKRLCGEVGGKSTCFEIRHEKL